MGVWWQKNAHLRGTLAGMRVALLTLPLVLAACVTTPAGLRTHDPWAEVVLRNPAPDLPTCLVRAFDESFRFGIVRAGFDYRTDRLPDGGFEIWGSQQGMVSVLHTGRPQPDGTVRITMRWWTVVASLDGPTTMLRKGAGRCGDLVT